MSGKKGMKKYPAEIREKVVSRIHAVESQKAMSREYGNSRWAQQYGLTPSMSRRGNCYDNAMAENFSQSSKRSVFTGTNQLHSVRQTK